MGGTTAVSAGRRPFGACIHWSRLLLAASHKRGFAGRPAAGHQPVAYLVFAGGARLYPDAAVRVAHDFVSGAGAFLRTVGMVDVVSLFCPDSRSPAQERPDIPRTVHHLACAISLPARQIGWPGPQATIGAP